MPIQYFPIQSASTSFLESEVARVDPSGSDGTGQVGDLNKPFLTVQGAIDAIEAGSFSNPAVDLGANVSTEDVVTDLTQVTFAGVNATGAPVTPSINSLSLTSTDLNGILVSFSGVSVIDGISAANVLLQIFVSNGSSINGTIENSDGALSLINNGGALDIATITATGATHVIGFLSAQNDIRIDCPGVHVYVQLSRVRQVLNADVLHLVDGRVEETINASSVVYDDSYLTPRWGKIGGDPGDNGDFTDWLYDDQGIVYQFIDKFELTPQASAPTAFEGVMYANSSSNHLFYHNGTTWKQLDNDASSGVSIGLAAGLAIALG